MSACRIAALVLMLALHLPAFSAAQLSEANMFYLGISGGPVNTRLTGDYVTSSEGRCGVDSWTLVPSLEEPARVMVFGARVDTCRQ